MAQTDKERWNEKYKKNTAPQEPTKLLLEYAKLSTGTQALDLACGMGRNAKYLASQGFTVDALDISSVAIASLQNLDNIRAKEVDFDTYALEKNKYDLIVCTYFLERTLFPQFHEALKENGILVFETFLHDEGNERAPSNPAFMLKKDELKVYFESKFELVHMDEWWDVDFTGVKTMKASMVAKKK
ncbi:MAG: methyltransferase domain-containing protein [Sulfurovum sp.]|nr:methyltransferase domain-containing protein [Sulfurovum sp.]